MKFKITSGVVKDSCYDGIRRSESLAHGECVREAESAEALRAAWERDMRICFPEGPDYNIHYSCVIEPVTAEPIGVADAYSDIAAVAVCTSPYCHCDFQPGSCRAGRRQVGKSKLLAAGYGAPLFRPGFRNLPRNIKIKSAVTVALAIVIGILVGAAITGFR